MWQPSNGSVSAPTMASTTVPSPIRWPQRMAGSQYCPRLIDSTPPATATSQSPSLMACAADTIACSPLPHSRFSVIAGVCTPSPPLTAATRARYMSRASVWMTWPKNAWPTASGSTPARLTASRTTVAARSHGGTAASPPPYFPIAVLVADKTKTSLSFCMAFLQSADLCSHVQTAVDGPDLPGDVGGLVRREEADDPGDLLRPAKARYGYLRANPLENLVGNAGKHVRGDKAGRDGVDRQPDSVPDRALRTAELEDGLLRQCLGQAEQARLGRRVVGLADVPGLPDDRGHADDPAGAARDHVLYGGLRHEERARKVDRDHLVPVLVGHLGDGPVDRDPRVVHQDVQVAVPLDDLMQHPAAVRWLADVPLVQRYPSSRVVGGHSRGELFRALTAAPVAGRDLGTVGGKLMADGRADAASTA